MTNRQIRQIKLNYTHYDTMLRHIARSIPREACGVILGEIDEDTALALEVYPTRNINISNSLFTMDPMELCNILMRGDSKGLEMIAVFHSHDFPPYPSSVDCNNMKLNPVVWIIFSLSHSEILGVAAYQLFSRMLNNVEIKIE